MSLIDEIQNQKPVVRHTFFVLSVIIALAVVGLFGVSALYREMYAVLHTPEERAALAQRQDARIPDPLAFVARAASSLTASIGALIGFDREAGLSAGQEGFDREEQSSNTHGGIHLLPLSQ